MKTDLILVLSQRSWQALSGIITIILIAYFLTPELQGWYYSFLSIAALYTLFDLGLSLVIVQIAANLFIDLRWGKKGILEGNGIDVFQKFSLQVVRHYCHLSLLFALLVIPGGYLFFSHRPDTSILELHWIPIWICLAGMTGVAILTIPVLALLEGSGNIKEVYLIRLIQGLVGSFACWAVLASGGGLWATLMPPMMGVFTIVVWVATKRPLMLKISLDSTASKLDWRTEIWPLQWKISLTWLSGYLLTAIYTPILFRYQGAVIAGQMGLSLTVANMLGLLAQSWITSHIPAMAQAATKKDWKTLDRLFLRDLLISSIAFLIGAGAICVFIEVLQFTPYKNRTLAFWPFFGLLTIAFFNHIIAAFAAQLRSYKQEPMVWLAVASAVITAPCAIWASTVYSAIGVVTSILSVQLLITLPISIHIWKKSNTFFRKKVQ